MNPDQLKSKFDQINVWKKGGQRAVHKPLLILYALARFVDNDERFIPYTEIDKKLKDLLIEFGPSRQSYHPEYPFWRLQNDGIWELKNAESVKSRKGHTDASRKDLLKHNVYGGFKEEVLSALKGNSELLSEIAANILEQHFPASIHEDVLQAVGLDITIGEGSDLKTRDPHFRERVLRAYEYKCAVCGFNVRVGNTLVGLEAAHIKWHQAGGPDLEENGVALCSLHHKLFDRGAFTISKEQKIIVSDRANGSKGFKEWLMDYHGKILNKPQSPSFYPKPKFVTWHVREVFQGESRYLPSSSI